MKNRNVPVWCCMTCDSCSKEVSGIWANTEYIPYIALFELAKQGGARILDTDVTCSECIEKEAK